MSGFSYFLIKTASLLSNGTVKACNALTKEQFERVAPKIDSELVANKNAFLLHPKQAPGFYTQAVDKRDETIAVGKETYRAQNFIEDKATGLRASIYGTADGNKVLVFNGIAKPVKGDSTPFENPKEFQRGLNDVNAAASGLYGPQMKKALELYQNVLSDPSTKKLQVVGYSLGSLYANEISGRFKQTSLTFANLGTNPILASPARIANMRKNVTNLYLSGDGFEKAVGPVYAKQVNITQAGLSSGHNPSDYALHARPVLAKRPRQPVVTAGIPDYMRVGSPR